MTGLTSPFGTVHYELGRLYTWADIEAGAHTSGVLRQLVDSVNAGYILRETALCTAVMYLAEVQIRNLNEQVKRLSLQLPSPIIIPRRTA